jgi:hypothetical protein
MDQNRPDQEIRFLEEISQMKSLGEFYFMSTLIKDKQCTVPIIFIFTKYEAFRNNVKMDMENEGLEGVLEDECKRRFEEYYLNEIRSDYVALESEYCAHDD